MCHTSTEYFTVTDEATLFDFISLALSFLTDLVSLFAPQTTSHRRRKFYTLLFVHSADSKHYSTFCWSIICP